MRIQQQEEESNPCGFTLREFTITKVYSPDRGALEKGLIPGLGQEIHRRSLEHLIVPGSKEAPDKNIQQCGFIKVF